MVVAGLLSLVIQAQAETILQWGEAPSGAGSGGTNIVVPPNKNIVFSNRSELVTYTGQTNNPSVGGTNYYWNSAGRAPYFSAAVNDSSLTTNPVLVVEQANSGDRITIYGGSVGPAGTYRGMVMWPFGQYFTGRVVSLTAVSLAINQRLNTDHTNQAVRVVVQEGASFYISGSAAFGANVLTQSFTLASETWRSFTPFSNGIETIGSVVTTPSFSNCQAVGYYFTAQNGGSTNGPIGAQVQYFAVQGGATPIPFLGTLALLVLGATLCFVARHRLDPAHARS
jgi:hypothetical protein